MRQHPDIGGSYTAQNLFRQVLETYFIDLKIPKFNLPSEADFTINGPTNPFLTFHRSSSSEFFSFIPEQIKEKTLGVIAHQCFLAHFSYAYQLSRHLNVPLYLVPHGTTDPYVFSYRKIRKKIWLELIGKPATNHAKKIIFSTKAEMNKSLFHDAKIKGAICPWSVKAPHINRSECRRYLRQKFSLGDNEKILLYFGRIEKMKRPLETLLSFLKVKPQGWKLLLVGPHEDERLKKEIQIHANSSDIIIHPSVFGEDKWKFIGGSDLYILLSHRENFGFTVVEAASFGLPVYISTGVDIHPFFKAEKKRLVFDIRKSTDIDQVMMSLEKLDDNNLQYLGDFCRKVVIENFTFDKFANTIKRILLDG